MTTKKSDKCLEMAADDEPIFVLLARDFNAPSTVLHWINESFYAQPNEKLKEAFELALKMKDQRLMFSKKDVIEHTREKMKRIINSHIDKAFDQAKQQPAGIISGFAFDTEQENAINASKAESPDKKPLESPDNDVIYK